MSPIVLELLSCLPSDCEWVFVSSFLKDVWTGTSFTSFQSFCFRRTRLCPDCKSLFSAVLLLGFHGIGLMFWWFMLPDAFGKSRNESTFTFKHLENNVLINYCIVSNQLINTCGVTRNLQKRSLMLHVWQWDCILSDFGRRMDDFSAMSLLFMYWD